MTEKTGGSVSNVYPMTLLYDASCPVCSLEMDHLRARNDRGLLQFVDISAPDFDPAPYGASLEAMNAEIHALCADGRLLKGVQVLRLAYEAAGLGWLMRPVGFGPLRGISERAYRVFARHRRPISRAAAPLIGFVRAMRARRMNGRMQQCAGGACSVDDHGRAP
jgi:predicted DCC family thiol-disulfide oxidoreductase YuxK